MITAGLFILLRRLEHWLHQHIFKVGWLVTKNFYTTTIIFYAFFLPGVFLYELSYWLMAGILNVPAERAIKMPEKQEIAQLNLNFIKLPKNTPPFKLAIITAAPLITGLFCVWVIANSILDLSGFTDFLNSGNLDDIGVALARLTSAPDFWLWIYLMFTISNTMVPNLKDLRGARILLIITAAVAFGFILLGVGDQVVVSALTGPIPQALYLLSSIFIVLVGMNLFVTAVLGTIEAVIERITGHSATFEKGRLIAMTRQELLEMKRRQATRALQSGQRRKTPALHSVYELPLPIPGGPDREAVTHAETQIIEPQAEIVTPTLDSRPGPAVIAGVVAGKPALEEPEEEIIDDTVIDEPEIDEIEDDDEEIEDEPLDEDEEISEQDTDDDDNLDDDDPEDESADDDDDDDEIIYEDVDEESV